MLRSSIRSLSSSAPRLDFARMQLFGVVGKVVQRELRDNVPFLTYSLAVNRFVGGRDDKTRVTDWYNVSVFEEKQVQFFENHLGPGATLIVDADVTQRQVVDESGEGKQIYTTLKQRKFDVVRFPAKKHDGEEEIVEESA